MYDIARECLSDELIDEFILASQECTLFILFFFYVPGDITNTSTTSNRNTRAIT